MSSHLESDALLAAARDAVLVVDDTRTFVDANPAACRMLGLPCDQLRGRGSSRRVSRRGSCG
jgi:PAS domain S-box-containing protein